ncbi:ADP-ribosylation factor-binding protein GGA2 [Ochlerotatus camptorhynchus]|uniref:ADP-ribosylation factor-binding protein GGA2 n=1 Tax=Ochlerotatus camptorhynchus TaxID=644619 RepID=UPI0031D9D280
MDSVTALDGYLRKAVNPKNADLDISAIDQFCLTLKKDPSLMTVAPSLLAGRIQSGNTKEATLALDALEECMETCGREFRSEINKFRFLNELIKLVSKKFDGDKTPKEVSERILNILLTWTNKYENCGKIQEAYNLLKTQGIEHHPQQNVVVKSTPKNENRGSLDEKEFAKLRQLIHSSKQEDRDKANLLIQNFYRDDERRTQMKNRRFAELEKVAENTKLLDEMLSQYRPGETSEDELAIIREIFESCEGMHPTIIRLAEETQQSEGMLEKIFEVNDNLTQVLDKYRQLILKAPPTEQIITSSSTTSSVSFSKVASPYSYSSNINVPDPLDSLFDISTIPSSSEPTRNPLDDLSEIFSSSISSDCANAIPDSTTSSASIGNTDTILTPLVVSYGSSVQASILAPTSTNGLNKYSDIQDLLQNNINGHVTNNLKNVAANGDASKKPSSTSTNSTKLDSLSTGKTIPDLDFLVSGMKSTLLSQSSSKMVSEEEASAPNEGVSSDDDDKVLNPITPTVEVNIAFLSASTEPLSSEEPKAKHEFKSLAEIVIDLDNIQPSREPSRTVLNDKDGLQITLNFASDHPRPDVTVIVISTINQGRIEIPSFHFDASVRKPCKLRLLPASGVSLSGTKPFRPPADGITQVLLLANPSEEPVDLTCILTYCVGDDPDPIKESIMVKDVPFIRE